MWHRTDFHQRYFKVEFGSPFCFFFEHKEMLQWHKSHRQSDIRACKALSEAEIQERVEEKKPFFKRSNSRSLLRKLVNVTYCKWNFGFVLEFAEREYELYAPTRKERDKWVEVLGAVAEMNLKSIGLNTMSPLEYLKKGEQPHNQASEDARPAEKETFQDDAIFRKVQDWLQTNEELMAQH